MKNEIKDEELVKAAIAARDFSYSPYSGFKVGAALLGRSGKVYTGVNVENAAFSPTNCAERSAFFRAVSEGEREFSVIAIAGWRWDSAGGFAFPCGVCRQVMMEFCNPAEFRVIVSDGRRSIAKTLSELLPEGFGPDNLRSRD